MIRLLSWFPIEAIPDLGWALIHFLWQGLLLAALLQLILPAIRGAKARHNLALATLMTMAAAPVVTFLILHRAETVSKDNTALLLMPRGVVHLLGNVAAGVSSSIPISLSAPWADGLVACWLAGIAILSVRALGGWYLAQMWRHRDVSVLPAGLLEQCRLLQRRLKIAWPVAFFQSNCVHVPTVIGWLRPVVLIPVCAISGLSPQQLDALITHELAHIRRHDAFINIFLLATETILFYHPAVWWVSRRVRIERENCCDDVAVSRCGDASIYVEALASLESRKLLYATTLAANGGQLRERAARLLDRAADERRYSLSALTGFAFIGLIAATVLTAKSSVIPSLQPALQKLVSQVVEAMLPSPANAATITAQNYPSSPARSIDALHAGPLNESAYGINKMIAVVNDTPIYERDLEQRVQLLIALTSSSPANVDMGQLRAETLQRLEGEAVEREMATANHISVSSQEVDQQIDQMAKDANMTPEQFREMLARAGASEEALREQIIIATAWKKLAQAQRNENSAVRGSQIQASAMRAPSILGESRMASNSGYVPPRPDGSFEKPLYPQISRSLGEQGTTVLALSVDKLGNIAEAKVSGSSGKPRLDKAALDFARTNLHFFPAAKAGVPVPASVTEKVIWSLT